MPLPRAATAQTRYKRRALTDEEWAFVRERISDGTPAQRRLGAIFDLLYFTGLRLAGVTSVCWGDLERVVFDAHTAGWMLRVTVKGAKLHEVPVPDDVVDSLYGHASDRGLSPPISVEWHTIPLLGRIAEAGFSEGRTQRSLQGAHEGLSQHTIAELVKGHFERCATAAAVSGDAAMSAKLRKASTHWMRHTHATHALASGVELEVVRDNLAHASIATTSIYLTTEQKQRMKAMQGFWKSREKPSAEPKN
jgi:site-specific recombinase XerD